MGRNGRYRHGCSQRHGFEFWVDAYRPVGNRNHLLMAGNHHFLPDQSVTEITSLGSWSPFSMTSSRWLDGSFKFAGGTAWLTEWPLTRFGGGGCWGGGTPEIHWRAVVRWCFSSILALEITQLLNCWWNMVMWIGKRNCIGVQNAYGDREETKRGFVKIGDPSKWLVYCYKWVLMDDWGVPLFWETPKQTIDNITWTFPNQFLAVGMSFARFIHF